MVREAGNTHTHTNTHAHTHTHTHKHTHTQTHTLTHTHTHFIPSVSPYSHLRILSALGSRAPHENNDSPAMLLFVVRIRTSFRLQCTQTSVRLRAARRCAKCNTLPAGHLTRKIAKCKAIMYIGSRSSFGVIRMRLRVLMLSDVRTAPQA